MDYSGPAESTFHELLDVLGVPARDSATSIRMDGEPPVLKSPHRIGLAASLALLAQGAATAALWEQRGGDAQEVRVDSRHSVYALNPIACFRRNGYLAWDRRQAKEGCSAFDFGATPRQSPGLPKPAALSYRRKPRRLSRPGFPKSRAG